MKTEIYSHCDGEEIVKKSLKNDLLKILQETDFEIKEGCSVALKKTILAQLKKIGWSDEFKLDANSQISLTSSKDDHVLCFQTGNMGRFYADLLKMQFIYENKKTKAAIYLIPSKEAAKLIGSNIANFNRFIFELNLFKEIISVPTLVIGIN